MKAKIGMVIETKETFYKVSGIFTTAEGLSYSVSLPDGETQFVYESDIIGVYRSVSDRAKSRRRKTAAKTKTAAKKERSSKGSKPKSKAKKAKEAKEEVIEEEFDL